MNWMNYFQSVHSSWIRPTINKYERRVFTLLQI
jgi:hypothetical protein